MRIRARLDRLDRNFIEGWIIDDDSPDQKFHLQFYMGANQIGEAGANQMREDLKAAGFGDGAIAFSFPVPQFLPKFSAGDLRIRIAGTDSWVLPEPGAAGEEARPPQESPTVSRFGGLWIDRADFMDRLAFKHRTGALDDELAAQVFRFVRDGYLVIPGAVPQPLIKALNEDIARVWSSPPQGLQIETFEPDGRMKYIPPQEKYRAGRTKLLDLFTVSEVARQVTAAALPMRFLSAIFEDVPKAFQQLTFWRGSQQAMHKDTAYVKIDSNPLALAATWLALEDVQPGTGELEYYVGSHRAPDFLFGGVSKWMESFTAEHDRFLASLHEDAERYQHRKSSFLARAGDVLIWHSDLAHGGSAITQPDKTRQSLVTHFTPAGEEPFYRRTANHPETKTANCVFVSQYGPIG